jgi:hypothetical protein
MQKNRRLSSGMDGWLCWWRRQVAEQWDGWMDGYVGGDARWLNSGMDGWIAMLVEMAGS